MKTLVCAALALGATLGRAQQPQIPVGLAWTFTPPSGQALSNYVFVLRSTTTVGAPMPWPVIGQTTGTLSLTCNVPVTVGGMRYFYVGVQDPRSSPTNYVAEAPPANVVQMTVLPPASGTTIGVGQ